MVQVLNVPHGSRGQQGEKGRYLRGQVVTGVLCRKTDPKIATAPKTQSRGKDQNKDKIIQSRIKR